MESKQWTDPIVEEVRAAREALFREAHYDLKELHCLILQSQKRHMKRLVNKRHLAQEPIGSKR
jgi:hypothetical protein